eukprot:Sspe_Gene.102415::Locus_77660_Transcript_1_1_Confidence_1.000_Length_514::g.102415::m.102415/K03257/EIF4A; translation initiation factor 4A
MAPEVLKLAERLMREPVRIRFYQTSTNRSFDGIRQFYVEVEEKFKFETILDLYECVTVSQSVIYCNTSRKVDWLQMKLKASGFSVSYMHSKMKKSDCKK